jgi:hypothetical protein
LRRWEAAIKFRAIPKPFGLEAATQGVDAEAALLFLTGIIGMEGGWRVFFDALKGPGYDS